LDGSLSGDAIDFAIASLPPTSRIGCRSISGKIGWRSPRELEPTDGQDNVPIDLKVSVDHADGCIGEVNRAARAGNHVLRFMGESEEVEWWPTT
jgi:hypothetical protein